MPIDLHNLRPVANNVRPPSHPIDPHNFGANRNLPYPWGGAATNTPPTNVAGTPPGQVPTTPYGNPTNPTTPQAPTIQPQQVRHDAQSGTITANGQVFRPPGTPQATNPTISIIPPQGGAQPGAASAQPGALPNINTSITPLLTYPEQLTETARNQIVATQAQASDPRWLTKRFASPGRSNDAGVASAAMPFLAQGQYLGNKGYADLSMGDFVANQEGLLAGEIARDKEGLGLGNLLARLQEGQTQQQNQLLNPLLMQLLG